MANTKQPVSLLEAKGRKHLTKNEVKTRRNQEVKAKADNILPPEYLPEKLQKRFTELANELVALDIFSNLDCDALARYVSVELQYQKATKKAIGMCPLKNNNYYPLLIIQEKLFKMARGAASDLGLTITSRCKLVVPKAEEKAPNKFNTFTK